MTLHVHDQRNLEKDQSVPAGITIYNDPEQIIFYINYSDDRRSVTITKASGNSWKLTIFKKGNPVQDIMLEGEGEDEDEEDEKEGGGGEEDAE